MIVESMSLVPIGDEVAAGIIVDTDSPAIMQLALERWPGCTVKRLPPCRDLKSEITEVVREEIARGSQLVLVIGGSGGGDRFDAALAPDMSHSAIRRLFPEAATSQIWGSNGHLFCEMTVAAHGGGWAVNVPGPQLEAVAAAEAAMDAIIAGLPIHDVVRKMAEAVARQYPAPDAEARQ